MKVHFIPDELRYIATRTVPLLCVAGSIWYCHRPVADAGFSQAPPTPRQFHEAREVMWVNADSLQSLIEKIADKEPGTFELETGRRRWTFTARDNRAFERIFLDGEPLSNWDSAQNPSIEKLENGQGFTAAVKTLHGKAFVKLPAEVVQSIQIAY